MIINQGATPYEVTAVQIGGAAQTINWQGGSQPTGNANGIDAFSFTILNDGGTYVVLGQMGRLYIMPILSTVNGSFFAGRRSSAFAAAWNPATDITTAFWIDASDTGSYTLSGSTVTAVTDKASNFSITVNGTPTQSHPVD